MIESISYKNKINKIDSSYLQSKISGFITENEKKLNLILLLIFHSIFMFSIKNEW